MRIFLLKNRSERCSLRYGSDKLHSSYPVQGYVVNADIFIRLTKISGKKKQKLHLWRKQDIQKLCEHQAHRCGIHISRVSARNTSRLAYDGSGKVDRSTENHSLCRFTTGKCYHCDLSASYNIGARYFIRELLKSLPATEESRVKAKVPDAGRRTSCTLSTLRALVKELSAA